MKTWMWIAIILACSNIACWARLGETEAECANRYGPALKTWEPGEGNYDLKTIRYAKNGYAIELTFIDGKCVAIVMAKDDRSAWSDNEIDTLLKANSQGKSWNLSTTAISVDRIWARDDGGGASYGRFDHQLFMASPIFMAEMERRKKEKEKKDLKDF